MANSSRNPFAVEGVISVVDSSTVMLVRQRNNGKRVTLTANDCGSEASLFLQRQRKQKEQGIFGANNEIVFECGWEVLLGQAEVINWLKTSPKKISTMRYGGEWKLAGGNVDKGESIAHAAVRELQEEFLDPLDLKLPADATLRPFVTKQTRPIRSRSNLMHCFIAVEDENPWLENLDVDAVNRGLEERRREFQQLSLDADGTPTEAFYNLSPAEREAVTPEVREIAWVPLHDAIRHALSSMSPDTYVNAYQRESFRKYGKRHRDPMFITGAILMELEGFANAASVISHCKSVDLVALTKEEQWLFSGMNQQNVDDAFNSRDQQMGSVYSPFKNSNVIATLRQQRSRTIATAHL